MDVISIFRKIYVHKFLSGTLLFSHIVNILRRKVPVGLKTQNLRLSPGITESESVC